ncbi:MAG: DUF2933 domain-containing protein [Actinomycetota bacterium]|nr:DUF2933 domain-containing protein [Actinomycetota bacterium]
MLGMCINKKVVAGLAAVGFGIWWLAPGVIGAALPLLLLALCPLSMLLMMKAMGSMNGQPQAESTGATTSAGEPSMPAGQLALPLADDGAVTADATWERQGPTRRVDSRTFRIPPSAPPSRQTSRPTLDRPADS